MGEGNFMLIIAEKFITILLLFLFFLLQLFTDLFVQFLLLFVDVAEIHEEGK